MRRCILTPSEAAIFSKGAEVVFVDALSRRALKGGGDCRQLSWFGNRRSRLRLRIGWDDFFVGSYGGDGS